MLDRLKRIAYRPDFFHEGVFSAGRGMAFYSLSVLLLVAGIVATMLPGAAHIVQSMRSGEWEAQRAMVSSLYPAGLVVSVKDGTITTNQADPVVIPIPSGWQHQLKCTKPYQDCRVEDWPANLIAIDTDQAVSVESFERYQSVVVIGQHDIGFRDPEHGETRTFNLRDSGFRESFAIDSGLYADGVSRGFNIARVAVIVMLFIVPVFLYLGFWVGYLAYSLFGALVVMLAAHVNGHTLRYGRAYLSTLYLLPVPFVFSFLMSASDYHIPFVTTLSLFVMALFNFPKAPKLPEPVKIAGADGPVDTQIAEVESRKS